MKNTAWLANLLVSTNAWIAVVFALSILLLPKTIIFTLLFVLFFMPEGFIPSLVKRFAPKLENWLDSMR